MTTSGNGSVATNGGRSEEGEASAAELRAVIESMTDAVYIGVASGITLANQAALDQLGFATREELNRGIATLAEEIQTRDAATGMFIPAEEQAFSRALRGERVVQDVIVRHRTLGVDRVVRCAAAPVLVDGRVIAAVAVNTDVTERRSDESRRQEAEERYLALFNAIDQGFCTIEVKFDASGRPVDYCFLEVSPSFERQTGIPDGAGRWMRDIAPDQDEHWFERYGRVARTGEAERFEEHSTPLGRWWSVYAFRIGDPAQQRIGVLFHDVSQRKRAEAERERLLAAQVLARREVERLLAATEVARRAAEGARAEAEAANRAKSEFLAVMSHELRTPLNAIGGYTELIELGVHGPVTDAQRTALERIQLSQRHLLGLIAGVLDYSRVEAGAVTYRLTDVPVTEAVADAELLIAPQLRAKGLGYAWSGAAPGLTVRADREKLHQILLNLLGNAVKFTYARAGVPGRIEVECSVAEAADGNPAGDRVCIHVRDTGDGVAPGELERIFEPFVQADQRLTRPHGGVGLGLAISRDLARGMGGDLTASSTPGAGSTFTLVLPRN